MFVCFRRWMLPVCPKDLLSPVRRRHSPRSVIRFLFCSCPAFVVHVVLLQSLIEGSLSLVESGRNLLVAGVWNPLFGSSCSHLWDELRCLFGTAWRYCIWRLVGWVSGCLKLSREPSNLCWLVVPSVSFLIDRRTWPNAESRHSWRCSDWFWAITGHSVSRWYAWLKTSAASFTSVLLFLKVFTDELLWDEWLQFLDFCVHSPNQLSQLLRLVAQRFLRGRCLDQIHHDHVHGQAFGSKHVISFATCLTGVLGWQGLELVSQPIVTFSANRLATLRNELDDVAELAVAQNEQQRTFCDFFFFVEHGWDLAY